MEIPWFAAPLFFFIALLYSTMGFGGGSSYIAALVLAGMPYAQVPPIALTCNLIVAGIGFVQFGRAGHFDLHKVLPFVILSVPMAYWAGTLPISKELFCFLLGLALLAVGIRMLFPESTSPEPHPTRAVTWKYGVPTGGVIGFVSGLLGIGGGIFLSPILLLIRWANAKQAAASASFFILVNSLAALAGHMQKAPLRTESLLPLAIAVGAGGLLGSRLGAVHLPKARMRQMLGIFILYASFKLLTRTA